MTVEMVINHMLPLHNIALYDGENLLWRGNLDECPRQFLNNQVVYLYPCQYDLNIYINVKDGDT